MPRSIQAKTIQGENSNISLNKYNFRFVTPACRRTSLLVLLACALGGAFTLEQPSGSLLEFYPAWREVMMNICRVGGNYAVLGLNLHQRLISADMRWCHPPKQLLLFIRN